MQQDPHIPMNYCKASTGHYSQLPILYISHSDLQACRPLNANIRRSIAHEQQMLTEAPEVLCSV